MSRKFKIRCGGCNKLFVNTSRREGKNLCYWCMMKAKKIIQISPNFFGERMKVQSFYVSLTDNQQNSMKERVKNIYGKYRGNLGKYLRALILADLENLKNESN